MNIIQATDRLIEASHEAIIALNRGDAEAVVARAHLVDAVLVMSEVRFNEAVLEVTEAIR
jgi:hypothetical protein